LRWVSRFAVRTQYSDLGELTVSMLRGTDGKQRKEVAKLTGWLGSEVKPEAVLLTNALLSGIVPDLKRALGVPVLVTLQGDDIFLDALPESYRKKCAELIRRNCAAADAFVCTSRYYADHMAGYLGLPREQMHVVYPGLNLAGHGGPKPVRREPPYVIGYFHNVVHAFIQLRKSPGAPPCKLRASGWLGENHRPFFEEQVAKLTAAGLAGDFEYVESPTHADKVRFLQSVDVLAVPTTYREPKGIYVLEAWANGVPVVKPRHGAFPELVEATGAGLLGPPNDPAALAAGLREALEDVAFRERAGKAGAAAVAERFTAEVMAKETVAVLEKYVPGRSAERGARSAAEAAP
jgi:glycosyltransferase involved in cell wall biosynthesis